MISKSRCCDDDDNDAADDDDNDDVDTTPKKKMMKMYFAALSFKRSLVLISGRFEDISRKTSEYKKQAWGDLKSNTTETGWQL